MGFKVSKLGAVALFALLLLSVSLSVVAAVETLQVYVYIMNPLDSANGVKGVNSGGYWVGEIPMKVGNDIGTVVTSGEQTKGYCMNFDKTIYVGSKYPTHMGGVTDTAEWRAVSYILTWYDPPADNTGGAENQVAIWRMLNNTRGYDYAKPSWLSQELDNAGSSLADVAYGKDVIRNGDVFQWIEPVAGNMSSTGANPGESIAFKAKITTSDGTPKAGVKVLFSAAVTPEDSALNSTYLNPAETHTDNDGIAEVTVTVPPDTQSGSKIEVKAYTKGVWPQMYLDLDDDRRQDLIGFGTSYELTVSTDVWIVAFLFVIPEVPLGTLAAGLTFAFAFLFWKKGFRLTKS
jgi:hypothetical protein